MTARVSLKRRLKRLRRKITYSELFLNGISLLGAMTIRIYVKLLRTRVIIDEETKALGRRKIMVAFWHGRLLLRWLYSAHGIWSF